MICYQIKKNEDIQPVLWTRAIFAQCSYTRLHRDGVHFNKCYCRYKCTHTYACTHSRTHTTAFNCILFFAARGSDPGVGAGEGGMQKKMRRGSASVACVCMEGVGTQCTGDSIIRATDINLSALVYLPVVCVKRAAREGG